MDAVYPSNQPLDSSADSKDIGGSDSVASIQECASNVTAHVSDKHPTESKPQTTHETVGESDIPHKHRTEVLSTSATNLNTLDSNTEFTEELQTEVQQTSSKLIVILAWLRSPSVGSSLSSELKRLETLVTNAPTLDNVADGNNQNTKRIMLDFLDEVLDLLVDLAQALSVLPISFLREVESNAEEPDMLRRLRGLREPRQQLLRTLMSRCARLGMSTVSRGYIDTVEPLINYTNDTEAPVDNVHGSSQRQNISSTAATLTMFNNLGLNISADELRYVWDSGSTHAGTENISKPQVTADFLDQVLGLVSGSSQGNMLREAAARGSVQHDPSGSPGLPSENTTEGRHVYWRQYDPSVAQTSNTDTPHSTTVISIEDNGGSGHQFAPENADCITCTSNALSTPEEISRLKFDQFKVELRRCLRKIVEHLSDLSLEIADIDLVQYIQDICSQLTSASILKVTSLDRPDYQEHWTDFLITIRDELGALFRRLLTPVGTTSIQDASGHDISSPKEIGGAAAHHTDDSASNLRDTSSSNEAKKLYTHIDSLMTLHQQLWDMLLEWCSHSTADVSDSTFLNSHSDVFSNSTPTPDSSSCSRAKVAIEHKVFDDEMADDGNRKGKAPDIEHSDSVPLIAPDTVWLGGKHDGYPLSSILEYKGIRHSSAHLEGLEQDHPVEYAALHQSHLTFGLMEAITQEKVPENYLLRRSMDGTTIISMRHIPCILRTWLGRLRLLKSTDVNAHRQALKHARNSLLYANKCASKDSREFSTGPFGKAGIPSLDGTAILLMAFAIQEAFWGVVQRESEEEVEVVGWTFMRSSDFNDKMAAEGWCPFTIAHVALLGACALGYASTCRPVVRKAVGDIGHHRCTADECVTNTVDTATYTCRHVDDSCRCTHLRPPLATVVNTVLNDEVPVIIIPASANVSDVSLDLQCVSSSDTPYIAFSHVWADGLGSTTEDGLPTCQLQRLAALARQLIPRGAFWIDGLCIPQRNDIRKRAIGLMARTYREAEVVLVIDSGIRSCSVNDPIEKRLLHIATSAWMQRLWTLQEAVLARRIVFEFSDGLMEGLEMTADLWDDANPLILRFASEINRQLIVTNPILADMHRQSQTVNLLFRAIQTRSTSRPADETLAISSLLQVDAYELAQLPPEQRMKTLLLEAQKLPAHLPFINGPKMSEPGFRWASRTLLGNRQSGVPDAGKREATCTPYGLIATYFMFEFDSITFPQDGTWTLVENPRDPERPRFYVTSRNDFAHTSKGSLLTCNALLLNQLPDSVYNVAIAVIMEPKENLQNSGSSRMCTYVGVAGFSWLYLTGTIEAEYYVSTLIQDSDWTNVCIT